MAQVTTGIRSVLSLPSVYDMFQEMLGASHSRETICREHIRASAGDLVVDVGCGTASILDHLPRGIAYIGFDLSERYIEAARQAYGDRGVSHCRDITSIGPDEVPRCTVAIAIGILHHLDDAGATNLIKALNDRLVPGGRLITVDPAYWPGLSGAARFLISRDRGQNVRNGEDYRALAARIFRNVTLRRRDDLLNIPYSHAVLECTK